MEFPGQDDVGVLRAPVFEQAERRLDPVKAVCAFGIADDEWQKAVTEQLGKLQHTSNLYYTEPCAKLAELLCTRTGMKKVFFSNEKKMV